MVVIEWDDWYSAATALVIVVPVGWIRWMDSLSRSLSSKFVEHAATVVVVGVVEAWLRVERWSRCPACIHHPSVKLHAVSACLHRNGVAPEYNVADGVM